jgi:predicted dehydrogenase
MLRRYNVAIIGAGKKGVGAPDWNFIYDNSHADAVNNNPRLTLSAICDIDPDKTKTVGSRLGVDRFTDWREMIEIDGPDIVTVAAGPEVNVALIRNVLPNNNVKGLFVEKPLALSLKELDELAELQESSQTPVEVNYKRNFGRTYDTAMDFILNGGIGRLQGIQATYNGGILAVLPHLPAFLTRLFPDGAKKVSGVFSPTPNLSNAKDPNVNGTITYSFAAQGRDVDVQVMAMGRCGKEESGNVYFWDQVFIGSEGTIRIGEERGGTVEYWKSEESRIHGPSQGIRQQYYTNRVPLEIDTRHNMEMESNGIQNLVDVIEDRGQVKAGLALARDAEEISYALRESAMQDGVTVHLPLQNRDLSFDSVVAGGDHLRKLTGYGERKESD